MGQLALIVDFEVKEGMMDEFMPMIAANARLSVEREPGCHQFDVLHVADQPNRVVLYEIYDDEAAFEAHRQMPHVLEFFAKSRPMLTKQTATRLDRVRANAKA